MTENNNQWTCYTDGGCQSNPGPCSWGVVVIDPNGNVTEGSGFIGDGTNQVAELTAALRGLEMIPEGSDILLISDSQYTLKGISEWRCGWESKGYTNSSGNTISNLDIWMSIYAAADLRQVKTKWVKGHSGDVYNERCDVLATRAIEKALNLTPKPEKKSKAKTEIVVGWVPIFVTEPENVAVIYGLADVDDKGTMKIVKAQSGMLVDGARDVPWATHWMPIPELIS